MVKGTNYLQTCKKHIDFIYELTKEGYNGSMASFGSATMTKITAELVKRGVLSKNRDGVHFTYMWVAKSAPTDTFYVSVAREIAGHQKEIDSKRRNPEQKKPKVETEVEPKVIEKSLSDYSIQELWDELKSRGVQIEGGKLVVIHKTYFS